MNPNTMRELLPILPKPSRYLGIEEGAVRKDGPVLARVGLAFPDLYEVGMSYLGQKILYGIINKFPEYAAERVFAPCRETGAVLRERGLPLCTLETDTPIRLLDVLGFSVTHELCYSNILYMLDLGGLPLRSADRKQAGRDGRPYPLVLAGGCCAMAAEPLAPFVDLMFLGEAEDSFPEILGVYCAQREKGKEALLESLSRIPGVYVPEFFPSRPCAKPAPRPVRRVVPDMNRVPYPTSQPVAFGAVHNRLALEIARGCTRGCRFCQAGVLYRPARERGVEVLRSIIDECLALTGYDDLSFLSLSSGDFSALKELFLGAATRCAAEQVSLSLPSLRVGSVEDALMQSMAGIRRTGATLAPEAGSQRLRDVINKGIGEEELITHVRALHRHGWRQVKLYFMIGLPTETDEDLSAITDLCRKARDAAGPGSMQITASISPFVPKPHTPFQREAQISLAETRRRIGLLLEEVKKEKRVTLRWHVPEMSLLEGIFSRGDRRLAGVLERAYRKGAVFADWVDGFSLDPWLEAMAECGLDPEDYLRARAGEEVLPWDHLDSGIREDFFLRERERALRGELTPDCRYFACNGCGVCGAKSQADGGERLRVILNRKRRDQDGHLVPQSARAGEGRPAGPENPLQNPEAARPKEGRFRPRPAPPELAEHLRVKAAQMRFWYSRLGPAAYLSQLEMQRVFDRALRRAGLPLSFSQGFHPLPLLSFGRALPVGVASLCEWFSIYLRAGREPEQAALDLNGTLPAGIRIVSAENLPLAKKGADAAGELFHLEYAGGAQEIEDFHGVWERIALLPSLPWTREGKRGSRALDARPFFANIAKAAAGSVKASSSGGPAAPGGAVGAVDLALDWSAVYVSPLALCAHSMAYCGFAADPARLRLTKTGLVP
jgi:radical SAM family uncharacterized protein/radical SAM-linked protein